MTGPGLTPSQSLIRKLSTMVAAVAALAVIAMGVQIGTSGLGFSNDRAPATATARPASALVDLAIQPTAELELAAMLAGLLPPGATEGAATGAVPQGSGRVDAPAPPAPEPPAEAPAVPAPSDLLPSGPVAPEPAPPVTPPPVPAPAVPVPVPPVPPQPEPDAVVDPVTQVVEDVKAILGL